MNLLRNMKEINFKCDKCKKPLTGTIYELSYGSGNGGGIMGDNRFPDNGFHYDYDCFHFIVSSIVETNKK